MTDNTRTITVVYITDDGFSMPTTISIASLIHNSGDDYKIKIYDFCDNVYAEKKGDNKEIIFG